VTIATSGVLQVGLRVVLMQMRCSERSSSQQPTVAARGHFLLTPAGIAPADPGA
jgi:hypothetical protein